MNSPVLLPPRPSLYADTAVAPTPTPPLDADKNVSVAIVGGGFTGLSTALHLAEQGVNAIVLEAQQPGWGASGNNGGQVNPGLKHDPDQIEADFGTGHQVATIGHILHSEGPERSRELLRKTFAALAPGGTIAIAEFLPNEERTAPPTPLIFAVNMLIHTEIGDTFTFSEIAAWLREAGFVKPRLLEAPSPSPLILATKP